MKETEKYDFTDRLKDLTDEGRAADTILKHYKLGPLYSIGLSKGIKNYNPDNFEHDKRVSERVTEIQNKLNRQGRQNTNTDIDLDEVIDEMNTAHEIELDLATDFNQTDDYNDGDPWGDETTNRDDYD